jgi:hypothetical protein
LEKEDPTNMILWTPQKGVHITKITVLAMDLTAMLPCILVLNPLISKLFMMTIPFFVL